MWVGPLSLRMHGRCVTLPCALRVFIIVAVSVVGTGRACRVRVSALDVVVVGRRTLSSLVRSLSLARQRAPLDLGAEPHRPGGRRLSAGTRRRAGADASGGTAARGVGSWS